jgi:hypothetical protein
VQQQLNVLQFCIGWLRPVVSQRLQLLPLFYLLKLRCLHVANLFEKLIWLGPADNHPRIDIGCGLFDFVLFPSSVRHQLITGVLGIGIECIAPVLFLLKIVLERLFLLALEFLVLLDIHFMQSGLLHHFHVLNVFF